MIKTFIIFLSILSVAGITGGTFAQERRSDRKTTQDEQSNQPAAIFDDIEKGIAEGNVSVLANYFSPQTYLSLANGVSGYFSSNQAYYVLEDFFKIHRAASFRFTNVQIEKSNPYATGIYNFEMRGKRSSSRVYISLKLSGENWKIIQITFN